ncbi:MAG: hypothetical protein K0R54_510, partial [Clostridiaceae bacterium]|nr:hypothetical protein [Clostridiaceae bacterium]
MKKNKIKQTILIITLIIMYISVGLINPIESNALVVNPQIVEGEYHTLALMEDGTVKAWGRNNFGEVGIGNTIQQTSPVTISGLNNVKQISAGSNFSIALLEDGTVKSWGYNSNGQLGIGNFTNQYSPTVIQGLTNVKEISAGRNFSLALMEDGTVKSWGFNGYGQLGVGTSLFQQRNTPITIPGLTNVKQIIAGEYHAFAIMVDGTIKGWGYNEYGALGNGNIINQGIPISISIDSVKQIVAGNAHTIALMNDGTVKSWGANNSGQLGIGNTTTKLTPVEIPGLTNVKKLKTASSSVFALMEDGNVKAWGANVSGQLGIGNNTNQTSPVVVSNLSSVVDISTGYSSAFAIMADETVMAWGRNEYGQLGIGNIINQISPVLISDFQLIVDKNAPNAPILTSSTTAETNQNIRVTIAYPEDAFVKQFKVGETGLWYDYIAPVLVTNNNNVYAKCKDKSGNWSVVSSIEINNINKAPFTTNPQIVVGDSHALALMGDGTLKAWGQNSSGEVGIGNKLQQLSPVTIPGLTNVKQVSAKASNSFALIEDGTVKAWGSNGYGQLGIGHTTGQMSPVIIPGLINVKQITASNGSTFALLENGTVRAWGRNDYGQLGIGNTTQQTLPVIIPGLSNVNRIVVGDCHVFALLSDGTVKAWGYNLNGQLGIGNAVNQLSPVTIPNLINLKQIVAGRNYTLALLEDGTIKVWGQNAFGELGLGNKTQQVSPVTLSGITNVKELMAGAFQSFALMKDGTVKSWGYNAFGQLGIGNKVDQLVPVDIPGLSNVIQISSGNNQTFVILGDGTVKTWGYNNYGQLGIGNTIMQLSPVIIPNLLMEVSDNIAPTAPIIEVDENILNIIHGVDDIGIKETQYQINNGEWLVYSVQVTLEDGEYIINAKTIDNANNESEMATLNIVISKTAVTNATNAVITAETTKLQADVDSARVLVNALSDTVTEKALLIERLNVVQDLINNEVIVEATNAVAIAVVSKSQSDVNNARVLVNSLQDGIEKEYLAEQLNNVQRYIDVMNALMEKIAQLKNRVSGSTQMVSTSIEQPMLLVSTGNLRTLFIKNELPLSTITDIQAMIDLLPAGEDKDYLQTLYSLVNNCNDFITQILNGNMVSAEATINIINNKITTLPAGEPKVAFVDIAQSLTSIFEAMKTGTIVDLPDSGLKDELAIKAVEKAELTKLQSDVDYARNLVNSLSNNLIKTDLNERIDIVQSYINAVNAVINAENNKTQSTVDNARVLVNTLPDTEVTKESLNERLDSVQEYIDTVTIATTAVIKAEGSKLQVDVDSARTLVNALPTGNDKTTLTNRLNTVQAHIDYQEAVRIATLAVIKAETTILQSDVDSARVLVNVLINPEIAELTLRLDAVDYLINCVSDATNAVLKAETTKLQADVDSARTLVNALNNSIPVKLSLIERLDIIQDYIDYQEQLTEATNAVIQSENNKIQVNVDNALILVNELPDSEPTKSSLIDRLNIVQAYVDAVNTATESVAKAEGSKFQADVESARVLVNALPNGSDKVSLTNRLDTVQAYINYQEAVRIATLAVEKAETTILQIDVDDARILVNALVNPEKADLTTRLDAVDYLINCVKDATLAVEKAELSKLQADVDSARILVNALDNLISQKASLSVRLDVVQACINAVNAVINAENSKTQSLIDSARILVNALSNGEPMKDSLTDRLNTLQAYVDAVLNATTAVVKAEDSKSQIDIDSARTLVNALPTGNEKISLTNRLNTVQTYIDYQEAVRIATLAVVKAETTILQTDVDSARDLVNVLVNPEKVDLTTRLDAVDYLINCVKDATLAVEKAELSKLQADVDSARVLVNALDNSISQKASLFARLDVVQDYISYQKKLTEATNAVINAENNISQTNLDSARVLVNALPDSEPTKTSLINRLNIVQAKVDYLNEVAFATEAVEQAEATKLQDYVDVARILVNELVNPEKADLNKRLDAVQLFIDYGIEILPQDIDALNGFIEIINLLIAENYVDAQIKLNELNAIIEAIVDAESKAQMKSNAQKLQDVIDAGVLVEVAETSLEQSDLDIAKIKVNSLPNTKFKQNLLLRIGDTQIAIINKKIQDILDRIDEILDKDNPTPEELDELEDIIEDLDDLINELPNSPEKDEILENQILLATQAVIKAETTKIQINVDSARLLVNALPSSEVKTSLNERLDIVQAIINAETDLQQAITNATNAVVKAEGSKLQADVDSARTLVNALPSSEVKTSLNERLDIVQAIINAENELQEAITNATNAVVKAEGSKLQADVDSARVLVNALPNSEVKTSLTERLNAVQAIIDAENELQEAIANATNAVVKAEGSKLQADVDSARTLVNVLPQI